MLSLIRTNSDNPDFIHLVKYLDADLAIRDGADHSFYNQFNKIAAIKHVVVAFEDDKPIGCGAVKEFTPNVIEVKRMYTLPEVRGKGIATQILTELESWAAELGYEKCVLETGKNNPKQLHCMRKMDTAVFQTMGNTQELKTASVSKS